MICDAFVILKLQHAKYANANVIYIAPPTIRPIALYRVMNNEKELSVKTNALLLPLFFSLSFPL